MKTEILEELKPKDLQLGNFINAFGFIEMVMGLIPREDKTWYVNHTGWNSDKNKFIDGIEFSAYPISLTDNWKKCLKIDKYEFPKWIEYVHQAQNYMKWYANVDLLEIMDWDLFKYCEVE